MGRKILVVLISYVVLAASLFALFTSAYLALGTVRVFQPGSYDVTTLWVALALVANLIGALIGGAVCALLSKDAGTPKILAGLLFVLGIALAIGHASKAHVDPGPRTGEVGNFDAMQKARMPSWFEFSAPIVGAVGVLIGGRKRRVS